MRKKEKNINKKENMSEKGKDDKTRHRNWMFTSYSPTVIEFVKNNLTSVKFSRIQKEVGELEEKEHYQGMIIFKYGKTFSSVKGYFQDESIHLEIIRDIGRCFEYCSKKETRKGKAFQYGKLLETSYGKKIIDELGKIEHKNAHRIKYFQDCILKDKMKVNDIQSKYPDFYKKYKEHFKEKMSGYLYPLIFCFCYGDSGTGKTLHTLILQKMMNLKIANLKDFKFYDGVTYDCEGISHDEFIDSSISIREMNRIIDNRSDIHSIKHSSIKCNLQFLFMTSNQKYEDIYKKEGINKDTFDRRIDILLHFKSLIKEDKIVIYAEFRDFSKRSPIKVVRKTEYTFNNDDQFIDHLERISCDIIESMIFNLRNSKLSFEKAKFIDRYESSFNEYKKLNKLN